MERTMLAVVVLLAMVSIFTLAVSKEQAHQGGLTAEGSKLNHGRRRGRDRPSLRAFSKQNHSQRSLKNFKTSRYEAQKVAEYGWQSTQAYTKKTTETSEVQPIGVSNRILFVTEYGADPTGLNDSTVALQMTINRAFDLASTHSLLTGVLDLGGVEIHLGGGEYVISQPLRLPNIAAGNFLIHGGTIRASKSFPSDGYLIELACSETMSHVLGEQLAQSSNCIYEDITIRDLMVDANFIGGGILVLNSVRTTIENCYITHFGTIGIMVHGGHETFIHNSFLGQHITVGGDPQERSFGGTAINLSSNDNAITDVVIFSAAIGIVVSGQANILTGVHCYNKATGFGGVGIHLQLPGNTQTRILGCYMDYTGIVLDDPSQVTITNTFFLGDAYVLLRATSRHSIFGLAIVNNMFSGSGKGVPIVKLDESLGNFASIKETIVDHNSASGMAFRSTRARATMSGLATNWTLDFSSVLLFPNIINNVQYSFYTNASSFPRHALKSVGGNKVVVASDMEITATVSVMVDQSDSSVAGLS